MVEVVSLGQRRRLAGSWAAYVAPSTSADAGTQYLSLEHEVR
jgi:hypothetical protein